MRKPPEAEPVPEVVQPAPEPIVEKDPFKVFPEKFRLVALEAEKNREFLKALSYWKVVYRFEPQNKAVSAKIRALENHLLKEAERHFARGLERFQKNAIQEARKEFLLCLTYQPGHAQAVEYLKYRLNEPDFLTYETREGDTLKKISREIYRDPDKDFLIAYFNDLEDKNPIKSGLTLKLPVITSIGVTKKSYSEERLQVRLLDSAELKRCQDRLEEHHHLGSVKPVGERLYYVATDHQGEWLALLVFAAAAKHLKLEIGGLVGPTFNGKGVCLWW